MNQRGSSITRRHVLTTIAVVAALAVGAMLSAMTYFGGPLFFLGPPKVSDVTAAARQKPQLLAAQLTPRRVEGVGFPDWSRWGWKPVGGRVDDLKGDRDAVSLRYEKGGSTIAYSIVEGPADVLLDWSPSREWKRHPPGGDVVLTTVYPQVDSADQLHWLDDGSGGSKASPFVLKREFLDHTVVLTAWPATEKLAEEAMDMALRTAKS